MLSLPLFLPLSLSLPFFFPKYDYKRGFSCFNLLPYPPAHISLGILWKFLWEIEKTDKKFVSFFNFP